MPIQSVAVVAIPGVQPFELGVAWEGFGIDPHRRRHPPLRHVAGRDDPQGDHRRRLVHPHRAWPRPRRHGRPRRRARLCPRHGHRPWYQRDRACSRVAAPHHRTRRHRHEPVLRCVHPGRRRPARRTQLHHPLAVRGGARRPAPGRAGGPQRALCVRRPGPHLSRYGCRARPLPAPDPGGPRRGAGPQGRAPHGHAAAPGRRPGAVPRRADPHPRRRHTGTAAGRAARLARRRPHHRVAVGALRDEPADVRPPVPGRDRHHARAVAHPPAGDARPAHARVGQRPDRDRGHALRVLNGGHAAPSLRPASSAPRRRPTVVRSAATSPEAGGHGGAVVRRARRTARPTVHFLPLSGQICTGTG